MVWVCDGGSCTIHNSSKYWSYLRNSLMKHPIDKAERLYINAKKDKRKKRKKNDEEPGNQEDDRSES